MLVIARGTITPGVVDFAWTDHNEVAGYYHQLDPDLGVYAVLDHLDAEGIKDPTLTLTKGGPGVVDYEVSISE